MCAGMETYQLPESSSVSMNAQADALSVSDSESDMELVPRLPHTEADCMVVEIAGAQTSKA